MLQPDQRLEAEEHFLNVLDLQPVEQEAYLSAHCPNSEIRNEVETLLRGQQVAAQAGGRVGGLLDLAVASGASAADPIEYFIGQRLGPFKIESILGQGGMGAVYLATRDDAEYDQHVAIKLVRESVASKRVLARFRQERQILAQLQHPNIARLLDGGTTPEGEPYLVMEYITGLSITSYCREQSLSTAQRVHLFRQVCEAVNYAHQNLVVHRDIKPSNILVTPGGTPKLLDFGIAKLIGQPEGAAYPGTADTQAGLQMLTPDYASPEQVRGAQVTTASDVYSLGALLFELLTGTKAHKFQDTTPLGIARGICDTETARPSTAVNPKMADCKRRSRDLSGDLDNIILMAMQKEPGRRYPSVRHFAEDLDRWGRGYPVTAQTDSLLYRTRKYVRRHWVGLAATAAVFLSLTIGAGIAIQQARLAKKQFQSVRTLANKFMFDFYDELLKVEGTVKAKQMVMTTALQYLDQLAAQSGGDAGLQSELAESYKRLGILQGVTVSGLGQSGSELTLNKAVSLFEELARRDPAYRIKYANCLATLANSVLAEGKQDTASAALQKSKTVLLQLEKEGTLGKQLFYELARASAVASSIANNQGNTELGIVEARNAVRHRNQFLQFDRSPRMVYMAANDHMRLLESLRNAGRLEEAIEFFEQVKALATEANKDGKAPDAGALTTILYSANLLYNPSEPSLERPQDAEKPAQLAVLAADKRLAKNPMDALAKLNALLLYQLYGAILEKTHPANADREYDRARQQAEELLAANPINRYARESLTLLTAARARWDALNGRNDRALRYASSSQRSFDEYPKLISPEGGIFVHLWMHEALAKVGDARAAAVIEKALSIVRTELAKPGRGVSMLYAASELYNYLGTRNKLEARRWFTEEESLWVNYHKQHPEIPYTQRRLARARAALNQAP